MGMILLVVLTIAILSIAALTVLARRSTGRGVGAGRSTSRRGDGGDGGFVSFATDDGGGSSHCGDSGGDGGGDGGCGGGD